MSSNNQNTNHIYKQINHHGKDEDVSQTNRQKISKYSISNDVSGNIDYKDKDVKDIDSKDILAILEQESSPLTKSERTRLKIIASAAKIFSEKGFHETSIQEIADEAGIAKGTIYYYVERKEDLIISLLEFAQSKLFARLEKNLQKHQTATEKIEYMLKSHLHTIRNFVPIIPTFAQNLLAVDSRIAERMAGIRRQYLAILEDIIGEGMQTGEFKQVDKQQTAIAILSLVIGQVLQHKIFYKKINPKEIIQTTLDVVVRSMRSES